MDSTRWRSIGAWWISWLVLAQLSGCGPSLPDAYGIYANTGCGRLRLEGQKVLARGNMFSAVHGIKGPSGSECGSVDDFIVYLKDVPPQAIALSRLEFEADTMLQGIFGGARAEVNLWMPRQRVEVDIKPVEKRADMYLVTPRHSLEKGLYALQIGEFGTDLPLEGGVVYDVAVGAAKDFPSYEAVVHERTQSIQAAAADLLKKMNEMFNRRSFEQLDQVYRPDGVPLQGEQREEFLKGNQTWFESAGKVVRSEILQVAVADDGQSAQCSVSTQYEKAGSQGESLVVRKVGDQFFIIEMK